MVIARKIILELKQHAPYTLLGAMSGVVVMLLLIWFGVSSAVSEACFWILHPLHVLLSAYVTAAMFRLNSCGGVVRTVVIGYVGSIGIATLSDSIIPLLGEWLLHLPHRHAHLGFIEKWWLVNPLACGGIALAFIWPHTRISHAAHVWLSTWASLFHMVMAMDVGVSPLQWGAVTLFLFLAVWVPCCSSDIVFPLLFIRGGFSGESRRDCPGCPKNI